MATKYSKIDKHRKMTNNQLNPSFVIHLIKISKTVLKSFEENLATSCLKNDNDIKVAVRTFYIL
ncbi:unnamed protein product [Clavelina lepadiformis]|uniref:Ribosomal protein S7 n=1 Tax=Clavelina lepadiformis TaxID=159417 RepID=A0ABP0GQD0_CLALP